MLLRKKKFIMLLFVVIIAIFMAFASGSSMGVKILNNGTGDITLSVSKESVVSVAPDVK